MGEILLKTNIKRENGLLYYCKSDKNGNIMLCTAKMARKTAKKSVKKKAKKK